MKKNKWVKENNKWLEYKCIKFDSKNKKYMSILHKAVKLHPVDIHYLVNTLEDICDCINMDYGFSDDYFVYVNKQDRDLHFNDNIKIEKNNKKK